MTTIDIHSHAIIPDALEEMAHAHPDHGPELFEDGGRRYLRYPGRERLGPLPEAIFEPDLRLADMDRQLYADHALTLALHPSETEERLLVRLLAFALNVPHDTEHGALQFARGLSDSDEPDLWQHDLTGQLVQWIEVGQPDDRRLAKACARAERVTIYCYGSAADIWWAGIRNKLTRLSNLQVWQIPAAHVDFRGDGGYVIASPSRITIDGAQRSYEVIAVATRPRGAHRTACHS